MVQEEKPPIQHSVSVAQENLTRTASVNRNRSINRKGSHGSLYPVPTNESLKGLRRDSLPLPTASAEITGATDLVLPPNVAFGKDLERGEDDIDEDAGEAVKEEKEDPYLIAEFEEGDPRNPKNWSSAYRWTLTFIGGLLVLNSTFSSSSPSGIALNLMQEFTFSREVATLAISLFVGGYCIGPLLWGPLSEGNLGRKWTLLIAFFPYWMFTLGCALAPNTAAILIFRLLAGCFGAAPLVVCGALISDLWDPKRRGIALSIFSLAPFAGPAIAPIVSGFISASGADWRILFWVLFAFAGSCTLLIIFVLPETYAPALLSQIAKQKRKETGDDRYKSPLELRKRGFKSEMQNTVFKPFRMLILEPMLLSLTIFMSVVYGVLYLLFEAYPFVFGPGGHNFNEGIQGLMFLPLFIGGFIACLINVFYFNPKYIKAVEKYAPKLPPPEIRLEQGALGGILFSIGFFWFGWTSYPSISFWSPLIAGGLIGMSILFIFLALFNYLIDTYLWSASSALAANTIVRSAFGAGFPLFASQMFEKLNPRWASTLLGCIAVVLSFIPFALMKYGSYLRTKSKFAPDL
ncbi:MFS general substrate transporter [Wallemia mellicola]|nr:MFS general substrate transporter [Wallemia mellicola]